MDQETVWVFGYGSLVYKPGFEYSEAVQGYIKGFRRVFWQGSTDHRGTPEAPGRTVTLHPDPAAVTWGVAYRLAGSLEQQQQAIKYLERREVQYDQRHRAHVFSKLADVPAVRDALVYVATPGLQNVNYLGPAPLQDIAAQVAAAAGPSGRNCEYVFRLADAMREMRVEDGELFELEAEVRRLLGPSETAVASAWTAVAVQTELQQQQQQQQEGAVDKEGPASPSSSSSSQPRAVTVATPG